MKKISLGVLFFLCLIFPGLSQETQVSAHLSSGYFFHSGPGIGRNSVLWLSDVATIPHGVDSPYGGYGAVSYGLGINIQKITSGQLAFGLAVSGESLASKHQISAVQGMASLSYPTEGRHIHRTNFLNFFPTIGSKVHIVSGLESTVLVGPDIGIALSSQNSFEITYHINQWDETYRTKGPGIDFRPRIEFVNYLGKLGLSMGYAHGLTDYNTQGERANSRYLRLGFHYKIK